MILVSLISLLFTFLTNSQYSGSFRKCKINQKGYSVGNLEIERIFSYKLSNNKFQTIRHSEPTYTDIDFLIVDDLTYGGSGEIFLIEEKETRKRKILKRFLKEKKTDFLYEHYIQTKINQVSGWHLINNSTSLSFDENGAKDLSNVHVDNISSPYSYLYEACQQLAKYHSMNLVHNDLKRLNLLV